MRVAPAAIMVFKIFQRADSAGSLHAHVRTDRAPHQRDVVRPWRRRAEAGGGLDEIGAGLLSQQCTRRSFDRR